MNRNKIITIRSITVPCVVCECVPHILGNNRVNREPEQNIKIDTEVHNVEKY